ncbi:MAG: hypothetical protein KAT68_15170 [Bacteroidales bacterium]|nr:hypothetical protein [Bacteroidales bacterium]
MRAYSSKKSFFFVKIKILYILIFSSLFSATNLFSQLPDIQFVSLSSSYSEDSGIANVKISLSVVSSQDVLIDFAVTGGTANGNGIDYTLANGTLTILSGVDSTIINIPIVNNDIYEINETIEITLSNPVGAVLGTDSIHTVTIIDDDYDIIPDNIEYQVLLDLYNSTNGANWTNNTNWLNGETNEDFANWYGITLTNGDITEINLTGNNLNGQIPQNISDLSMLKRFTVDNNQINGQLPETIGNLENLQYLFLSQNKLNGQIPASICNLNELRFLNLSNNELTGTIPGSIGNLTNLTNLYLNNNLLSGQIPVSIANLRNLDELYLSQNQLNGHIIDEICSLSKLTQLYLDENHFTGNIPANIGNINGLKILYISQNQLTGQIPASICNLSNLQYLYLNENQLSGNIPDAIGNLINLAHLYLNNNQLTGAIPSSIGNLIKLKFLHLNQNQLSGGIPKGFMNIRLSELIIHNNKFTGFFDFSQHASSGRMNVEVYNNYLDFGDIEPNFFKEDEHVFSNFIYSPQYNFSNKDTIEILEYRNLELILEPNGKSNYYQWQKKSGEIWQDIDRENEPVLIIQEVYYENSGIYRLKITNERITDLIITSEEIIVNVITNDEEGFVSDSREFEALLQLYEATEGWEWTNNTNWLQGETNEDFANWYGITVTNGDVTEINLSDNNLIGEIPGAIAGLEHLQYLDLSQNELTNDVTCKIEILSNLNYLNLSQNQLSGRIPEEILHLPNLNYLYLNNNQFDGEIFKSINELQNIQYLDFSHNNLSGEIPQSIDHLFNLIYLNLSNNTLSNRIPDIFGELNNLEHLDLSYNYLEDIMPVSIYSLNNLKILYLNNNKLEITINKDIDNLTNLTHLNFQQNSKLYQIIPEEIGNLINLEYLNLSNSDLYGNLPNTIKNLTRLNTLLLNNNEIMGDISFITKLTNLEELNLSENGFEGKIPDSIIYITDLKKLNLSFNLLSGEIPLVITELSQIQNIELNNNHFVSFPDFSQHPNRANINVNITDNNIGFKYLEQCFISEGQSIFNSFIYNDQAVEIGEPDNLIVLQGARFSFSIYVDGINNLYQWQENINNTWTDISNDTELVIDNFSQNDIVKYRLKITNNLAIDLVLYSNEITVSPLQLDITEEFPVTWDNNLGTIIYGDTLLNNTAGQNSTGGAISLNKIEAESNGYVIYHATGDTSDINYYRNRFLGLSEIYSFGDYNNIEYCFNFNNSEVNIYESGNLISSLGSYKTDDVFQIIRSGNLIYYFINGVSKRTVACDIYKNLLVDVNLVGEYAYFNNIKVSSFPDFYVLKDIEEKENNEFTVSLNTVGGTEPFTYVWNTGHNSNKVIGLERGEYLVTVTDALYHSKEIHILVNNLLNVSWTDTSNVNIINAHLISTGDNGRARSFNLIDSLGNGYFEYEITEDTSEINFNTNRKLGFAKLNTYSGNEHSEYCFEFFKGKVNIIESGVYADEYETYKTGDVFSIWKNNALIRYLKNGYLLREISTDTSCELTVTAGLYGTETYFDNVKLHFSYPELTLIDSINSDSTYIMVDVVGGVQPYTFEWSTGAKEKGIPVTNYGRHTVTVTDAVNNKKVKYFDIYCTEKKSYRSSDKEWNWTRTVTYDENGNPFSASKSYSDALGKTHQVQSKYFNENKVMVAQTVYDALGRGVLSTLPAPVNYEYLEYVNNFITNPADEPYTYSDFDNDINNPEPVHNGFANTLGWYYSNNNTDEPYVPASPFPYSRVEYSKTKPGAIRKSTMAGEAHRMGSGHETQVYTMPANSEELQHFKNDFDSNIEIDNLTKTIFIDNNGVEGITYTSADGKLITSCIQKDISYTDNIVTIEKWEDYNKLVSLFYYDIQLTEACENSLTINYQGSDFSVIITDMSDDSEVFNSDSEQPYGLNPGFYRLSFVLGTTNPLTEYSYLFFSYNFNCSKYENYSFNIYDKAGRIKKSYSPKAVDEENISMAETFEYNSLGWLIATTSPDEGRTEYVYRKDGSIRFSQNAKQRGENKFSFTDYDDAGRIIRVGEHQGCSGQFSTGMSPDIIIYTTNNNDVTKTYYDTPDDDVSVTTSLSYLCPNLIDYYKQHYLMGKVTKTCNDDVSTWYSYDYEGKIEWMIQYFHNLELAKTIDYTYDFFGNVIKVEYQKHNFEEHFTHIYEYDNNKRLETVKTLKYVGEATTCVDCNPLTHPEFGEVYENKHTQAKYEYYAHGPLKRVEIAENIQGIDYVYNINGWLKSINHPGLGQTTGDGTIYDPGHDGFGSSAFEKDIFGMVLDYYQNDYQRNNTYINEGFDEENLYNGNIKRQRWRIKDQDTPISICDNQHWAYLYSYNNKSWLNEAVFGKYLMCAHVGNPDGKGFCDEGRFTPDSEDSYKVFGISHDMNGNINHLNRNAYGVDIDMDRFVYNYTAGTNKLSKINDSGTSSAFTDLKSGQSNDNYTYNAIGQMTGNEEENQYIEYNVYGKVIAIYSDEGHTTPPIVEYSYDDKGFRYLVGTPDGKRTFYVRDLSGNIISIYDDKITAGLVQKEIPIYGASRLGTVDLNSGWGTENYIYELSDHLGNVRATFTKDNDSDGKPDLLSYSDYYPGGFQMPGRQFVAGSGQYRFGYQGQFAEKDQETGYNHFEARLYDSRIGRWMVPDPIRRTNISPYLGMGNNPIIYNDIDGRDIIVFLDIHGAFPAGHMGVLIGSDKKGWYYYSKNGTIDGSLSGPSYKPNYGEENFSSIEDFLQRGNVYESEMRYEKGTRISATHEQDEIMKAEAYKQVWKDYNLLNSSCQHVAIEAVAKGLNTRVFDAKIPKITYLDFNFLLGNSITHLIKFNFNLGKIPTIEVGPLIFNGIIPD